MLILNYHTYSSAVYSKDTCPQLSLLFSSYLSHCILRFLNQLHWQDVTNLKPHTYFLSVCTICWLSFDFCGFRHLYDILSQVFVLSSQSNVSDNIENESCHQTLLINDSDSNYKGKRSRTTSCVRGRISFYYMVTNVLPILLKLKVVNVFAVNLLCYHKDVYFAKRLSSFS